MIGVSEQLKRTSTCEALEIVKNGIGTLEELEHAQPPDAAISYKGQLARTSENVPWLTISISWRTMSLYSRRLPILNLSENPSHMEHETICLVWWKG